VLETLQKPIKLNKQAQEVKLPFALLTNGGGILEDQRAKFLNNIVWGESNPEQGIRGD